ncbi:MAG: DUF5105 domain-containing protein [Clostridium sp.]
MKKISKVLLIVLTLGLVLTGCGDKKPEISLEQQGKNYFTVFGQYDFTKLDEMGAGSYTKEDAEKDFNKTLDETLLSLDSMFNAKATDAQREDLKSALFGAIKKTTGTVEVVKEEKASGTVKISSNYIDMNVIGPKVLASVEEALANEPTLALDTQKTYDMFLQKYTQILNECQPSTETQSVEVEFVVIKNVWQIKNETDCGKISELTMKS